MLTTLLAALLVAASPLDGRVVDATTGLPIAGAIVTAGSTVTSTSPDGSYHVGAHGERVAARAIGYGRGAVAVSPASPSAPDIRLAPLRAKALYLSVYGIGDAGLREAAIRLVGTTEVNALVIDVKGDRGYIPYASGVAEAAAIGARSITTVHDMAALVSRMKSLGIYLIARIVVFKDDPLASAHPEWAVKTGQGELFRDREHLAWIDPAQRDAWTYTLDIAEEAARLGFDEIQFDYVRFPDARGLAFSVPNTEANRVAAVTGFLGAARARLAPYNVFLAADVFGYAIWNDNDTFIGQDIEALAGVVDYLSPMLYPSGFQFGIPGYADPLQHPHDIVALSLRRAVGRGGLSSLRLRPWLQAFRDYAFDRRPFGPAEIQAQIEAAEQAGSAGWMLWNPHNTYNADDLRPRGNAGRFDLHQSN